MSIDLSPTKPPAPAAGHYLVTASRSSRGNGKGPEALRVLVCEDDPVLALELEACIAECGAVTCGSALSHDEAHRLAGITMPDLAIVDLHLGDGRSGPRIAEDFAGRGIRVVIVSGDQTVDAVLARVDHVFLPKPMNPVILQDILRQEILRRVQQLGQADAGSPADA